MVLNLLEASMSSLFHTYVPEESMEEQWDLVGLENVLESEYQIELALVDLAEENTAIAEEELLDLVINTAKEALAEKVEQVGEESWQPFERSILLQSIDTQWRGHLLAMDHLRQRSEERRVGKESSSRMSAAHYKKQEGTAGRRHENEER